jgi:uncharacterized protein YktB (UPF0637 family)
MSRERIAELEAENAELREKVEDAEKSRSDWADVYELTESQLTRAVELLGKVRDAHHLPGSHCEMEDAVVEVDAFLSEMEDH